MPNALQFMDCPHCGKRIRTSADRCHHCQQSPSQPLDREVSSTYVGQGLGEHEATTRVVESEEQDDDDFDYEAFVEREFGNKSKWSRPLETPRWIWITGWILLISMCIPLVIAVFIALQKR